MEGKIAILKTGGTIESQSNGYARNKSKGNLHKNAQNTEIINSFRIMNKLSENMMPEDWIIITNEIKNKINEGYENIIITHGTDTMIYTASAVNILLGDISQRVVFTGAMDGPDSKNNDVMINIKASIKACQNKRLQGVFIALRSNESINKVYLHNALNVKPPYMDNKGYESLFKKHKGEYKSGKWTFKKPKYALKTISNGGFNTIPPTDEISKSSKDVKMLQTYPGIYFDDNINSDNIIISTYHSGTSSSKRYENSLKNFISKNNEKNIILSGLSTNTVKNMYETTFELKKEDAIIVKDIQPHVLYVSICLGLACNMTTEKILSEIWNIN